MRDSLVEKYPGASFHPVFATFGNQENTYTRHHRPERIDYLMFRYRRTTGQRGLTTSCSGTGPQARED